MAIICPTILSNDTADFRTQMNRLSPFAQRIQIDLSDAEFAPTQTLPLDQVWWPHQISADLHLMYAHPMEYIDTIAKLKPHMVIIHAEADVDHMIFAAGMHSLGIEAGLCILKQTPIESVARILSSFDHLLIFSGELGRFGGQADLTMLAKIGPAKVLQPELEIGWDGGVNELNAKELARGGVDILNVGGFIHSADNPSAAYEQLVSSISKP